MWEVVEFSDIHNHPMIHSHPMIYDKHKHFISFSRKLTPATSKVLASLVDSGVALKLAFKYLVKQVGGTENVSLVEQDVHNFQQ